jgi:hypothetical protein
MSHCTGKYKIQISASLLPIFSDVLLPSPLCGPVELKNLCLMGCLGPPLHNEQLIHSPITLNLLHFDKFTFIELPLWKTFFICYIIISYLLTAGLAVSKSNGLFTFFFPLETESSWRYLLPKLGGGVNYSSPLLVNFKYGAAIRQWVANDT